MLRSLAVLGAIPIVARSQGDNASDGVIQYVHVSSRGDSAHAMDLRWTRRALRTALRDAGPELLHIVGDPWTPTAEAGAAAARDLKLPYVLVATSSFGGPKGLTARWQADRVRNGAAALAGTVRSALELIGESSRGRPRAVLPQGGLAVPAHWEPRPATSPLIIAVAGRLVPERGVERLLDALAATYGEWRLRVIGTGPSHEALEQHAQRLGLSSRIEWLGALPRDELPAFWSQADVVVAPSLSTPGWVEPTGRVVLQAMAHGVAPVVSRSGALPDVVGDAGLIVEERDPAALARAIQGFVANPERARTMGAAARQRVLERYTDAMVAAQMVQLWQQITGSLVEQ